MTPIREDGLGLPKRAWRTVTWREGSKSELTSRFAVLRVRPWAFSPRA